MIMQYYDVHASIVLIITRSVAMEVWSAVVVAMFYFAELVLLIFTEICHFYQFRFYYLLTLLCVLRAWLTVQPSYDPNIFPVLQKYFFIKLNDTVVVAIWVLFPVLCLRSIMGLYRLLGRTLMPFQQLFCILSGEANHQLLRPMLILAILLTGASVTYTPRLASFIYNQWTAAFTFLVQSLQIYPLVLRMIQTLYQGMTLLLMYSNPSLLKVSVKENIGECKEQLESHIMLNITLLLHCVCICAVKGIGSNDIIVNLAVGEILYRFWPAIAFSSLRRRVEVACTANTTDNTQTCITSSSVTHAVTQNLDIKEESCSPGFSEMVTGRTLIINRHYTMLVDGMYEPAIACSENLPSHITSEVVFLKSSTKINEVPFFN